MDQIINSLDKKNKFKNERIEKELKTKSNFKLNENIIYLPIINFITLFNLNTKQKKHIIN